MKFGPELKTLTLIMLFNLYSLTNTGFINLGRAQFLCDLIIRAPIDICAHIFQTKEKIAGKSAAWMCLPFYSLIMKIMVLKGVHPPKDSSTKRWNYPTSLTPNILGVSPNEQKSLFLLNGKSKVPQKHQRVNLSHMPLLLVITQLLPLPPGILRLHFLTLLSHSPLALSWDHLVLYPIGSLPWLKVYMSISLVLLMSYTLPTTKFRCI